MLSFPWMWAVQAFCNVKPNKTNVDYDVLRGSVNIHKCQMQTRKTSRMNIPVPDIVNHHRTADKGTSRENQTALGSGRHFPLRFFSLQFCKASCVWSAMQPSEIMKMWRLRLHQIHFTQRHHPWWIFMDSSSLRCGELAKSLGNWPSRPNWKCIPASGSVQPEWERLSIFLKITF